MTEQTTVLLPESLWQQCFFTGVWQPASHSQAVIEPATGDQLGTLGLADTDAVAQACQFAAKAQRDWAGLSYETRAQVLRKAARLSESHAAELIDWLVRESGSIRAKAGFELEVTTRALYEASSLASRAIGEMLPTTVGRLSLARRRPIGVVGVISPFNFPLYLAMRAVAPALALGNAVVLKPDPRTAVCGGLLIARLFELAGLPAGVLQVLPGDGAAGAALTAAPEVAMIQFTGSTAAGRKVGEAAGRHLKKVSLELGGKNALIILDDADLELAVANASWGAFLHQGQICMSTGRILVQRDLYPRFITRLAEQASGMQVGNPAQAEVQLGPLINAQQRDHVDAVVQAAVTAGACLLSGGVYQDLFYRPTVLADVAADNPAFREEIFGPVAVVTPFDTDAEAIALANDTEYGLSMAVISPNVARALALAEQLHTGLLHINDQTVNDSVLNPFAGVGASGNGSSIGGAANGEEFTQWQWLTIKGEAPAYPL